MLGLSVDLVAAHGEGQVKHIGDQIALGEPPESDAWSVRITEPTVCAEPLATVSFDSGGLATSVVTKRCWSVGDDRLHHIIDPRTGTSTDGVHLASALACEGWLAEVTTKALVGGRVSPALASVPALVLSDDGRLRAHAGMERYLGAPS